MKLHLKDLLPISVFAALSLVIALGIKEVKKDQNLYSYAAENDQSVKYTDNKEEFDENALNWIHSQLPVDTYIKVHAEKKNTTTNAWEPVIKDTQPFKSLVDHIRPLAYWRKDFLNNPYYGEIYRYDNFYVYLYSESFGAPIAQFGETKWDVRQDRFRMFVSNPTISKNTGRIFMPIKLNPSWQMTNLSFNTYLCKSFSQWASNGCQLWQSNFVDYKVSIELKNNFQVDYDGDTPGYIPDADFKTFDNVLIVNQEMAGIRQAGKPSQPQSRERFIFGIKNGISYGLIRWDNATFDSKTKSYQITNRTTGLGLAKASASSLAEEGFATRVSQDPYIKDKVNTTIRGVVRDENGVALKGVEVTLYKDGIKRNVIGITDSEGQFFFRNVLKQESGFAIRLTDGRYTVTQSNCDVKNALPATFCGSGLKCGGVGSRSYEACSWSVSERDGRDFNFTVKKK